MLDGDLHACRHMNQLVPLREEMRKVGRNIETNQGGVFEFSVSQNWHEQSLPK